MPSKGLGQDACKDHQHAFQRPSKGPLNTTSMHFTCICQGKPTCAYTYVESLGRIWLVSLGVALFGIVSIKQKCSLGVQRQLFQASILCTKWFEILAIIPDNVYGIASNVL